MVAVLFVRGLGLKYSLVVYQKVFKRLCKVMYIICEYLCFMFSSLPCLWAGVGP